MECESLDENGWCTTRFSGFACVGVKCSIHPDYSREQDDCQDEVGPGIYCPRYNRFFCTGTDGCTDRSGYIKKMRRGDGLRM